MFTSNYLYLIYKTLTPLVAFVVCFLFFTLLRSFITGTKYRFYDHITSVILTVGLYIATIYLLKLSRFDYLLDGISYVVSKLHGTYISIAGTLFIPNESGLKTITSTQIEVCLLILLSIFVLVGSVLAINSLICIDNKKYESKIVYNNAVISDNKNVFNVNEHKFSKEVRSEFCSLIN